MTADALSAVDLRPRRAGRRVARVTVIFSILHFALQVALFYARGSGWFPYTIYPNPSGFNPVRFFFFEKLWEVIGFPLSASIYPDRLLFLWTLIATSILWGVGLTAFWIATSRRTKVIVLVSAPILWLIFGNAASWIVERRLERRWTATWKSPRVLPRQIPRKPAARSADAYLYAAGLLPDAPGFKEWLDAPLPDYISAQQDKTDGTADEPPIAVLYLIDSYPLDLQNLIEQLRGGARATWNAPATLQGFRKARLPVHALTARAFTALAYGDMKSARETADALAMMARATREDTDYIRGTIWTSASRNLSAIARKLPPPLPEWHSEMLARDLNRLLLDRIEANALSLQREVGSDRIYDPPPSDLDRVLLLFVRPFLRLEAARASEEARREAEIVRRTPACDWEPEPVSSSRNLFSAKVSLTLLARLSLDLITTEQIDRARRGLAPVKDPRCGSASWTITRAADGSTQLTATARQSVMKWNGLPLMYRLSR